MRAELGINTLAELIALARAKPGAVLVEIVQRKDVRDRLLHTGFRATGKSSQAFRDESCSKCRNGRT